MRPDVSVLGKLSALGLLLVLATCSKPNLDAPPDAAGATRADGADTSSIHLVVRTFHSTAGRLLVSLYASKDGFPSDADKALRRLDLPIPGKVAEVTLSGVPAGRYAVSVLHDENGDFQLQTDWMGRPKEGWGVSNDARGRFGPPSFDDAAFDLAGRPDTLEIHLEYR
jgi:uncharacterized protein (DUF2141 family)